MTEYHVVIDEGASIGEPRALFRIVNRIDGYAAHPSSGGWIRSSEVIGKVSGAYGDVTLTVAVDRERALAILDTWGIAPDDVDSESPP